MKTLTNSQQEIINTLLKEFHGMNETNPIPFTLFNANQILDELKAKEIEKRETDLHNKAMSDELHGRLNDYVDILNNDFDNANLLIKAKLQHETIVIEGDVVKIGCYIDNSFDVRLYTIKKHTSTPNGFSKTATYLYANDTSSDDRYATIEGLLESRPFKLNIKRLIEKSIQYKK